ncbi:hypothetical protein JW766_05700 [Candidatus Dojkabacteria bacterium]|nr:hypothetical protein [Candidatus Dojkabacteria bacterium]
MTNLTISKIHKEFIPQYDRWHGKMLPRIKSWFSHIFEVISLWLDGDKPYVKHGQSTETSREHAKVELGDLLWLTAEIFWMITGVELPIVPSATLERVWNKLAESKRHIDS